MTGTPITTPPHAHLKPMDSPAEPFRRAHHKAGGGRGLQPPPAATIRDGSAAQPLGWVQGRSALPDVLLANTVVGPYRVSWGTEVAR